MILTITLNPALDKSFTVDRLEPDHKLRSANPIIDAGGGGINVARGIQRLGAEAEALILSGGLNGQHLLSLLSAEQIPVQHVPLIGETRESIMIYETASGKQFRIIAEGPVIRPEESASLLQAIDRLDPFPSWVVASGSLPHSLPTDFYAILAEKVRTKGARFILDTSGEPLRAALRGHPWMIKPNLAELAALSGKESLELDDVEDAARSMLLQGACDNVVVSMGAAGAMMVSSDAVEHVPAPVVPRKSTVGAGDSMVAGIVWSLHAGREPSEALRMGVACGTAATMNPGTQLFRPEDARRLYEWLSRKK